MRVYPRSVLVREATIQCNNQTTIGTYRDSHEQAKAHADWLQLIWLQNTHWTMEQVIQTAKSFVVQCGDNMSKIAEEMRREGEGTAEQLTQFYYLDELSTYLDVFISVIEAWLEAEGKDDVYVQTHR